MSIVKCKKVSSFFAKRYVVFFFYYYDIIPFNKMIGMIYMEKIIMLGTGNGGTLDLGGYY